MVRKGLSVIAVGVLAVFVGGCGSDERMISPEELQRGVSAGLQKINRPHESVSCPDGVTAQAAESTTCTMTAGGARYKLTVLVKSVEGDQANYDIDIDLTPLP